MKENVLQSRNLPSFDVLAEPAPCGRRGAPLASILWSALPSSGWTAHNLYSLAKLYPAIFRHAPVEYERGGLV